jgi:hypothetical protein
MSLKCNNLHKFKRFSELKKFSYLCDSKFEYFENLNKISKVFFWRANTYIVMNKILFC